MTYGQMRDRVLMLLNQYSIAGGKIRVTYNNQADYLARVPGAVNEALVYLATTARRLRSVRKLEEAERAALLLKKYLQETDFAPMRTCTSADDGV